MDKEKIQYYFWIFMVPILLILIYILILFFPLFQKVMYIIATLILFIFLFFGIKGLKNKEKSDYYKKNKWVILITLLILNSLDMFTTYLFVRRDGIETEINLIFSYFFNIFGFNFIFISLYIIVFTLFMFIIIWVSKLELSQKLIFYVLVITKILCLMVNTHILKQ